MERVPLAEAARRLGIPITAARKRVARGTLPAVKVDGQWFVDMSAAHGVPAGLPAGQPAGAPASSPVEAAQAAEIAFLRAELEARRREVERLHTLLAQAQAKLLPPAEMAREREDASTPAGTPPQRAWWRFWRRDAQSPHPAG